MSNLLQVGTRTHVDTVTVLDGASYVETVSAVKNAVDFESKALNKWESAGAKVKAFFGTREAVKQVKTQFIADAIIPALAKADQDNIKREIPRKQKGKDDGLDDVRELKKNSNAKAETYFARVLDYAFGKVEKTETEEKAEVSQETKWLKALTQVLNSVEKAGDSDVDLLKLHANLKACINLVAKSASIEVKE